MDPMSLALFAGTLVVAAGSPGPSIAALVARVLARGHRGVWPFLAGMWIGEGLWLACAVWGLSALAAQFALAFTVVKWLGVGYLLWLAWGLWHAPATRQDMPETGGALGRFGAGLSMTLGNPKIMVFYVALLPALVDLGGVTLTGWAELTLAMLVVLVAVDGAWVLAATQARRLLQSPRAVRAVNRTGAGMMAGAAVAIATRG